MICELCDREQSARRSREAIERQAKYLSRPVDDLLDVRKIVAGQILQEHRPRDLADVVRACVTTLNEAGRFNNHTLKFDADGRVRIQGNEVRLHQIVVNLAGNAVKYTPAGA